MWNSQRTIRITLLIAGLMLLVVRMGFACPRPFHFADNPELTAHLKQYARKAAQFQNNELDADTTHSYDALVMDITLMPDLDARTCATVVVTRARLLEDVDTIPVNLVECTVHSVEINDDDVTYTYEDGIISVAIPEYIVVTDTFEMLIDYTSLIRNDVYFGGIVYSPETDNLFTFGEPFETRYWLACYDYPCDKLDTTRVTTIMDEEYYVVSNGAFQERIDLDDGTFGTVWENTYPIATYLISISAHPYVHVENGTYGENDTPVNFWLFSEDQDITEYEFGRTGEMIELLEDLLQTPYPFSKYDQAMSSIFAGWGAMEHQSATTYGYRLAQYGNRRFEDIVIHELGHQWFGDYVSPLTFANMWLNEGWASYTEALWHEYLDDGQMASVLTAFRTAYFSEDSQFRYAMYDPPIDYIFGNVVYDKAALVLHMLRNVIGDDAFWEGTRTYLQEYAYGNVVTDELKEHMEAASGEDLDWYFDQWVYSAGHPEFMVGNLQTESEGNGTFSASIDVEQLQTNAPLFRMPVEVRFRLGATDTLVTIDVLAEAEQTVITTGLEFEPTTFYFDPYQAVVCEVHYNGVYEDGCEALPTAFTLSEPWPNPFNNSVKMELGILTHDHVRVTVYDMLGREVERLVDHEMYRGTRTLVWMPDDHVASGSYLVVAETGEARISRRLTLLK